MDPIATFRVVDKQQAFDGLIQQVDLAPTEHYNDLELYLSDLVEYLQPQIDKILEAKARGIFFWLSLQVNYNQPLDRADEQESEDDEGSPAYLHTGKLYITNRYQLSEKMKQATQIILERNSSSIRGNSNVVIGSIGNVRFKVVNNANPLK